MTDSTHAARLPHTDNPAALAKPGGHYSHVAVANGFVLVSGQLPINAQGDKLADASFDAQAEQVLANVKAALESVAAASRNWCRCACMSSMSNIGRASIRSMRAGPVRQNRRARSYRCRSCTMGSRSRLRRWGWFSSGWCKRVPEASQAFLVFTIRSCRSTRQRSSINRRCLGATLAERALAHTVSSKGSACAFERGSIDIRQSQPCRPWLPSWCGYRRAHQARGRRSRCPNNRRNASVRQCA
ncbi:hypothetical protein QFZ89_002788 [Paraburkholderia youngii]